MEKQIKGSVQTGVGSVETMSWLQSVVSTILLIKSCVMETTFGRKQTIDDIYAVYVFRPEKARGNNGVKLNEFLGIGDIREILITMDSGYQQPIAFFPCCIPKIVPSYLYNEVSTMMIGGIWQKYRTIIPDEKWTLAAMFNVM